VRGHRVYNIRELRHKEGEVGVLAGTKSSHRERRGNSLWIGEVEKDCKD
jgi:hypothetical protein